MYLCKHNNAGRYFSFKMSFYHMSRAQLHVLLFFTGIDLTVKKSRLNEDLASSKIRSSLGAMDMNSDKFKEMMEKKSRHSNLVDVRTLLIYCLEVKFSLFVCVW